METGPAIDGELRDLCFGCNNTPSLRALVWCRSEFCALVGFRVGHCVALNSQVAPSGAAHLCLSPRLCATRGKVTASVALVLVSPFAVRVASIPRRIGAVGCPEPCAALIFGRERMGRGNFPFSLLFSTSSFACPLTVAMHEAPGFLAPSLVVFFFVAKQLAAIHTVHWDFLLTMRMFLCTGWRTIGWVTSYFALVTIRTLRNTSRSFGTPNSVRPFPPPLSAWLFSKMHILEDIHNWLLRTAPGFSSRRATCVAQACRRYISLRTRGARHLHATSPACGDVLQVGTA
jgi:hypothetical protein